ncbi:phospholipid-transporting ATPase IF [Episyrphus balteatus]|uniref:phospholipid-transporting ATPase IF n=1 Tax=Episyrphus balteatus TaxID=286459 RepID=UPI0024855E5E|nr:phospholipid-transporting ATPase IF [Episyrphus balteatus]
MNFIGRHDHLSGYRQVNNTGYGIPLWNLQPDVTSVELQPLNSDSKNTTVAWSRKGSRVNTINDWLRIKIGGDDSLKKKKNKKLETNRIKSTKYTIITFLPQNLLEQFRRIANFYFLIMTIISLLIDSPVSPLTSLLPLVFVISVTAAKQGYEDVLRYKTDNIVNCSPVTVIRDGKETHIECQHVEPGDLVVLSRDCDVPCDLVLMRSSDPHGKCFITTANLDGESNLKTLTTPRELPNVEINKMHKLGIIECEFPKTDLYSFNGKIELTLPDQMRLSQLQNPIDVNQPRVLPLTAENVLLRGSRIKNTECVIGCAIYTGMTTKLALNSRLTRNKSSSSEAYINRFLLFILLGMIFIVTVLYFLKRYFEIFRVPKATYLGPAIDTYSVRAFLQDYLSFLILFNYLIPISLYVTIEMHRVIGGFFMEWDIDLYDEPTDQPCIVNTSNLNEELGQINILFSDKTGTLTKNEMIFQQCSINGKKFVYKKTKLQEESSGILLDINKFNNDQKNFFQGLAVCHTVQVAGDMINNEPQNGTKTKKYSIAEITEESHNSSQQSDIDISLSTNPNGKETINNSILSDVNPLLDSTNKLEKRKRPEVVKRSPRFARPPSRVHPTTTTTNEEIDNFRETSINYSNFAEDIIADRPYSLPFTRSISEFDIPDPATNYNGGHRRTQSYGAPGAYITNQETIVNLSRSPSTISRESYAMPNFVSRQPSLLRKESVRRKNEIENFVEILDYQASSPDEKALVEACAHLGLVYLGDDDERLKVRYCPPHVDYSRPFGGSKTRDLLFDRLHVLEFTSDRKRMSVIVKDENGTKWIYTKGAESYIFPLCGTSSSRLIELTDKHISDFAKNGLRTLAVARKRISDDEYGQFLDDLVEANTSLENRKQLSEECYAKIERNLDLLGATAVEDALQDDVADTLVSLQKAGIKIWVLTGDKIETALNIALSCGHIPAGAMKYFIVECGRKEDLEVHLQTLEREIIFGLGRPCALLIDGKSLTVALKELPEKFRDVTIRCQAVLCCRLSPLQKSEVVSLIKTSSQNYNTAAIGDGANDVSMIQEAHIGIGIIGKEGRQAARCADFALARFNMIKRLFLMHGHYHTTRLSHLVLYFFYKNILFMGSMFFFQFHNMFSSQPVYDSWFMTLYNVGYTSVPIFFISLTEQLFTQDELMSKPELYSRNTNNKQLHWPYFLQWVLAAVYHATIIFYFAFFLFTNNDVLLNIGQTAETSVFGTLLMQLVVVVANLKLWLQSKYYSYWFIVTIWGSILLFVVTTLAYNFIDIRYDSDIYWSYNKLLCSIPLWFLVILTVVTCLAPDFTIRICKDALRMPKRSFYPGTRRMKKLRAAKAAQNTYL